MNGRVVKHFPNQLAEVLIGTKKVIAYLETPISVNERYWLQVLPGEGQVKLKVLETKSTINSEMNLNQLIREFSLPVTKDHLALMQFFINRKLPVTKEILQTSSDWLKNKRVFTDGLKVIDTVLSRQLPFSEITLSAIDSVMHEESISALLVKIQSQLKTEPATETAVRFNFLMEQIFSKNIGIEFNDVKETLQSIVKNIGFSYERETISLLNDDRMDNGTKMDSIKSILLSLLKEEHSISVREASENVINKITGYQLLSQETGPIQNIVFQIPLSLTIGKTDLTMQWSGRKLDNGQIDPDFCRILFYLDLEHLKELIIDMHVQNRVITIRIFNEHKEIQPITEKLLPQLKAGLDEIRYQLSSLHVESAPNKKDENQKVLSTKNTYFGVDVRI